MQTTKPGAAIAPTMIQTRIATVDAADSGSRCANITWSTGAAVNRVDANGSWIEELSMNPAHVRMGRLQSGAPLLDTHNRYGLSGVLGVVENAKVDGRKGTATVRFSKRAEVDPIFQDVKDKIIRNVSVGYQVHRYDDVSTPEDLRNGVQRLRATDWEPSEISLVPVGADANAGVRNQALRNACTIGAPRVAEQVKPATPAEMAELRRRKQELAEKWGL